MIKNFFLEPAIGMVFIKQKESFTNYYNWDGNLWLPNQTPIELTQLWLQKKLRSGRAEDQAKGQTNTAVREPSG